MSTLIVSRVEKEEVSFSEVYMTCSEFCDISTYPWITSSKFTEMIIDVDFKYPPGVLKAISDAGIVIKFALSDKVDYQDKPTVNNIITNITALHPEDLSKLRVAQIKEPDTLKDIISNYIA